MNRINNGHHQVYEPLRQRENWENVNLFSPIISPLAYRIDSDLENAHSQSHLHDYQILDDENPFDINMHEGEAHIINVNREAAVPLLADDWTSPFFELKEYELLTIPKTQLEQTPGRLLCSLHPLMQSDATLIQVKFINDAGKIDRGSDMGSLSLEFLHKLFQGVAAEKNGPLVFEENMPVMKGDALTVEERVGYEVMGRLMGMCIDEPDMRTGSNFPPPFFSALKAISAKDKPDLNCALKVFLALDPNKEIVVNCLRSKNLTADGLLDVALNWAFPEGAPMEVSDEQIQKEIMDNLQVMKRVQPFFSIVQGLQRSCEVKGGSWEAVRRRSFIALSQDIQGVAVSKEKIEIVGRRCLQKVYFKQWLEEARPELLELFVYVATGSAKIKESNLTISIAPAEEDLQKLGSPQFAACSKVIVVPQYKDYQAFKRAFELALGGFSNGGFTID